MDYDEDDYALVDREGMAKDFGIKVKSPQTLRDREAKGTHPKRLRIGGRVYWYRKEIRRLVAEQAAKRDN